MDTDKDGLLSASDLVAAFGAHGKSIGSGDAQVRNNMIIVCVIVILYRIIVPSCDGQQDPRRYETPVILPPLSY